jgi:hypothetical protein
LSRARRLGVAIGAVVCVLFAGRWVAGVLADWWWAAELSPAAATFLTQVHFLRFVLKLTGMSIAAAWFIGHFFVVYRAVGSVQIRRHVANLEIREALTPRMLLTAAIAGGALLGLVVGGRPSGWWPQVVLAWHGVTYGMIDPLLQRDLGLYVAQLPLWRTTHDFALILVVLALGLVFGLYVIVGAIRWMEGRPAINDHARRHLGWLLLALGVVLAWGYLLEPYELVAGLSAPPPAGGWRAAVSVAPVLAGIALAAGGLSAIWAIQSRHTLAAAGWIVLAVSSVIGHWLIPSMFEAEATATTDSLAVERFTRLAYGLDSVRIERIRRSETDTILPPNHPALWSASMIGRIAGSDSANRYWADPALVDVHGTPRPAWLVLHPLAGDDRWAVSAIADDRIGPSGSPLFYGASDSVPRPAARGAAPSLIEMSSRLFRPDAPYYRLGSSGATGVPLDSWSRRLVLTWALQVGALLGDVTPGTRVDWHLSPTARLARIAPFAEWGTPVMRVVDGDLVWISDGYVSASGFPLAHHMPWGSKIVGTVRPGFVGVVHAETGATHVYLRPGGGPLAEVWGRAAVGVVEPAAAMPAGLWQALPYPAELLRLQAQAFVRAPWNAGVLAGWPVPGAPAGELPPTETQWDAGGAPVRAAVYEQVGGRAVSALLIGGRDGGADVLRLFRLDSTATIPSRSLLESSWSRFPSYGLLGDSVQGDGGRLERGRVHYVPLRGAVVAYQTHFARESPSGGTLVWVTVAASRDRLGAGRSFLQAWNNLLGAVAPEPAGPSQRDRLAGARGWLHRADSALRAGDWATFGNAWRELQRALGTARDSVRRLSPSR